MMPPPNSRITKLRWRIGQLVAAHRRARNLRLIDVAKRTGYSLPKLCRIEFGRQHIGYAELAQIAEAIGVPVLSLVPKQVKVRHTPMLDFGRGVLA